MKRFAVVTFVVLAFLLVSSSIVKGTVARNVSSTIPGKKVTSEYWVTILPADKTVFVEAVFHGIKRSDITGWEIGVAGISTTVVTSDANGVRFAYSVAIPEKEPLNSPEPALDKNRFRSWGWSIFAIPILKKAMGQLTLSIRVPDGWSMATSFGINQTRFVLPSPEDFFRIAIVAGDFRATSFDVAGTSVYLAVRKGHPVNNAVFGGALKKIIETTVRYTGGKQPSRIMFGVDLLGGKKTSAPGNNVSTDSHSSSLLIDRDDANPLELNFFGTYAHEFAHTWIPAVFGDKNVTKKELGSLFSEGFTDYIAYRVTHSAGVHSDEQFARALSKFYLEYLETASSERTENNAEFLKYRQGMMAAWVLDIELRRASNGKNDFQKFIQMLVKQHANTGGMTKQKLTATLMTLGGANIVSLYNRLMQPDIVIDVPLHMKGTGIQVRNVQNPAQELKELSNESAPVVSFIPDNQKEREFLSGFLTRTASKLSSKQSNK